LPSKILHPRELLVLDEGHLLEIEIVKFRGLSISKRRWRRYIHDLEIDDYGYNDIEKWISFLIELESKMLTLTESHAIAEHYAKVRKLKYGWQGQELVKDKKNNSTSKLHENLISDPVQYYHSEEEEIAQYQQGLSDISNGKNSISGELLTDALWDTQKLTFTIESILSNPRNWIVSDIKKEQNNEAVLKVELKPLDISPYCKYVFDRCSKTLIMSATILNSKEFCRNVGLNPAEVKFIQVPSDFPIENRLIYPLNIAYLNFRNLQSQETKFKIAKTIDNIMSLNKNYKGIIHTTSYEQLNFIRENISQENTGRLLETDPDMQRDEVIAEHINSTTKPTVLISPSFNTGLDLKDDLSRFQIITKVPYPNLGDRWTNAKREKDQEWYYWQTALKLVQTYGRSVRSKEDWAKTYILDSAFIYFLRKNGNILPDWFKQAIK
jgi:ATP-dependent DNA helicase DinG